MGLQFNIWLETINDTKKRQVAILKLGEALSHIIDILFLKRVLEREKYSVIYISFDRRIIVIEVKVLIHYQHYNLHL